MSIVAALAACGQKGGVPTPVVDVTISQGGASSTLSAEVAATPDDRERGLMGRRTLAPDHGMLFVFPAPIQGGFWMKDTLIPLDIAFISHGAIVEIDSMVPCHVRNCPVTTPAMPYDTALELNAGYFRSHRFTASATVTLSRGLPKAS